MSGRWYYFHEGATHGPLSEQEIKDRVQHGKLLENDLVWKAGGDRKDAVPARAILDFSQSPAASSSTPDWLQDVARAERSGPVPGPSSSAAVPEWREDVLLWASLDSQARAGRNPKEATASKPSIPATPTKRELPRQNQAPPARAIPAAKVIPSQPDDVAIAVSRPALPAVVPSAGEVSAQANAPLIGETRCPICAETIKAGAKRCKHCGETLDPVLRKAEEAERRSRSSSKSSTVVVAQQNVVVAQQGGSSVGTCIALELLFGVLCGTFGIGHFCNGKPLLGVLFMFGWWAALGINIALMSVVIGFFTLPLCWIAVMVVSPIVISATGKATASRQAVAVVHR